MIHIYSAEKTEYIYAEQPSELSPKGDLLYLSTYPKTSKNMVIARHLRQYCMIINHLL